MKNKVIYLLLFLYTIFNTSCDSKKKATDSESKVVVKKYGGHLRLSLTDHPVSFFPLQGVDINSSDIIFQVYEGLVKFSSNNLDIVPAIAEKWEVDSSGKKYTFYIRKDVFFHDNECFQNGKGRNVNAHDVEYSLYSICTYNENNMVFSNTLKNKLVGANEYYEASKKTNPTAKIEGIQVEDDYKISITLIHADFSFLNILAMPSLSIVPKEAVEKYGYSCYVGSGPFKMSTPDKDRNDFVLVKNENYYRKDSLGNKLPFIDSVTFTINSSKRFEIDEFKKRNLDMAWGIPSETIKSMVEGNINKFENDSLYSLKRIPEYTTQYYIFNLNHTIFQDERVRKAINLAIDKSKIVDEILKGEAYSTGDYGITPPSMKDYEITKLKGFTYNPEEAKKLLAEAGYPGGQNFPKIQLKINNDGRKNVPVAVEISKQLERNLGISINMDIVSLSDKLNDEFKGNSDMYRSSWTADYPSPENFLNLFYGAHVPLNPKDPSFPNTSRFKDAEFDQKFELALNTADKLARYSALLEAEQILINKAPFIPIYYEENYALIQSYVYDFHFNSLKLKDLSLVFLNK